MYKVHISFNIQFEETFGFIFNKDGHRNLNELPCSIAKRWGHESYDLEAGVKAFLYMYGSEIGTYIVGDIEYYYEEGRLVNACYYVTFDKLPESLKDLYEDDIEDPYSYLIDYEDIEDEFNPTDEPIDLYPTDEPELPSEDCSFDEYPIN